LKVTAKRIMCGVTLKGRSMAISNPLQFIQQVRSEVSKVVWPTRREVLLTTVMVFVMAALAAVIFALVDLGIRSGLQVLLDALR
jgi:preprotein translocase subunit SecE